MTTKTKKPARAKRVHAPKPVEVGLIRPWQDEDDDRPLSKRVRDLGKVTNGEFRYRLEAVGNHNEANNGVDEHAFTEALDRAERAFVTALRQETGHDRWHIRTRMDAWKMDERKIEDDEAAFIEARLPGVTAVRVR